MSERQMKCSVCERKARETTHSLDGVRVHYYAKREGGGKVIRVLCKECYDGNGKGTVSPDGRG